MLLRKALFGACSEMDRVSCSFSCASRSIMGTRPQVDRLMFRIPMLAPSGWLMRCRKRRTSS